MEEFQIVGVTSDKDKFLVRVQLARSTVVGAVWDRAADAHLSIIAPIFSGVDVAFFSDRDGISEWKKIFSDLIAQGFIESYEISQEWIPLSIVGDRFSQDGQALSEVLDLLAKNHIPTSLGSASALAITVAIEIQRADDAVRVLHSHYLERS